MRDIVLCLGALAVLIGGGLVADGLVPQDSFAPAERRRRGRPDRHRLGEAVLGAGIICAGALLFGGNDWRYANAAAIAALLLLAGGVALNIKYIRGIAFGPIFGRLRQRRLTDAMPVENEWVAPVNAPASPDPSTRRPDSTEQEPVAGE